MGSDLNFSEHELLAFVLGTVSRDKDPLSDKI